MLLRIFSFLSIFFFVFHNTKCQESRADLERERDLNIQKINEAEKILKETENTKYTDLENIKKEVLEAKKTFQKYKWPLIDVTRKSVEETAASIIKIHEIYSNNAR